MVHESEIGVWKMRIVDLGNSAVAIEPDEKADQIADLDVAKLRQQVSDEAIKILRRYIGGSTTRAVADAAIPRATAKSGG
jgi:hypothetical protein